MNDYSEILSCSDNEYLSQTYICLRAYTDTEYWVDWIRIRKYSEPEPVLMYAKL